MTATQHIVATTFSSIALLSTGCATQATVYRAVSSGDVNEVRRCIDTGGDLNMTGAFGMTPLGLAASKGNTEMVNLLLDRGAILNATDKYCMTALARVLVGGAQYFKRVGSPQPNLSAALTPEYTHEVGCRSFLLCRHLTLGLYSATPSPAQMDMLRLLLNRGADPTAGAIFAERNRSTDKLTPVHVASRFGWVDVVKLLLDSGADVEGRAPEGGFTPLMDATVEGHEETVRLLLDNGANVSRRARYRDTTLDLNPLDLAAQNRQTGIAALLKFREPFKNSKTQKVEKQDQGQKRGPANSE